MGWSLGYDERWRRDIGYGVPAICDHPGCGVEIDRGLSYVCGGEPYGGENGCGLYFCGQHRIINLSADVPQCVRCFGGREPFSPTPDSAVWLEWKLTDPSWAEWRAENPNDVEAIREALGTVEPAPADESPTGQDAEQLGSKTDSGVTAEPAGVPPLACKRWEKR